MRKRNEYENELLIARNEAQEALFAKQKANAELEIALETLKAKQEELLGNKSQSEPDRLQSVQSTSFSGSFWRVQALFWCLI